MKPFAQRHDFLICIDSDGCAFDTMEIKWKECFIPEIIHIWHLQAVSKYARYAAEFVNLYSRDRGTNRFPGLVRTFDLLREWPEVQRRGARIPEVEPLRAWAARERKLGNPALHAEVQRTGDPVLAQALAWSEAANCRIAAMAHGVPPFPWVRESLEAASQWADLMVCSAAQGEALRREWEEHGLAAYMAAAAGQEDGTKAEQIAAAMQGRYEAGRVLMIGDALGDWRAAKSNGVRFFPINPGAEDASWEAFHHTVANQFHDATYTAECEAAFLKRFESCLPAEPWWSSGQKCPPVPTRTESS